MLFRFCLNIGISSFFCFTLKRDDYSVRFAAFSRVNYSVLVDYSSCTRLAVRTRSKMFPVHSRPIQSYVREERAEWYAANETNATTICTVWGKQKGSEPRTRIVPVKRDRSKKRSEAATRNTSYCSQGIRRGVHAREVRFNKKRNFHEAERFFVARKKRGPVCSRAKYIFEVRRSSK